MRDQVADTPSVSWLDQLGGQLHTLFPHAASIAALASALAGLLPVFVALIPAVYYLLLIYEGKTVQSWLERRRKRKLRKIRSKRRKA